jgi:hypothetical protein
MPRRTRAPQKRDKGAADAGQPRQAASTCRSTGGSTIRICLRWHADQAAVLKS